MLIFGLHYADVFLKLFTFLVAQFDITAFHLKDKGWIVCLVWQIPSIRTIFHSPKA